MSRDEPAGVDGLGATPGPRSWTPRRLREVRARRRWRLPALLVAGAVGVAAVTVHWLGLFVAGALVGLPSRTVPRAVVAGVAVGLAVLVLQVMTSPSMGPGEFLALTPPTAVTVAAALLAPAWGSLFRVVI